MSTAEKLGDGISSFHAGMTDDEIREAIIRGLQSGELLGLSQEKDWPTFSRFVGVYQKISEELLGGLSKDETQYVLNWVTHNSLNCIQLGQRKKKKSG